jgi:phage tail sheath protein FI
MPSNLTYPGVYIEEIPSGVRTITGVSTSVTAFIGRARKGPTDKAMLIHNFTEFQRIYGGLWKESYLGYVVDHYFNNGGKDALIIRVHKEKLGDPGTFEYNIDLGNPPKKLVLQSANPGSWAANLLVTIKANNDEVDKDLRSIDETLCNLYVSEISNHNQQETKSILLETFRNVSFKESPESRYIGNILKHGSELVRLKTDPGITKLEDGEYESNTTSNLGGDGEPIEADEIKGGLNLLKNVDIFNLLCIPSFHMDESPETSITDLNEVYTDALNLCETKRGFLIVDPLVRWTNKDGPQKDPDNYPLPKSKNAAMFFPRLKCPDKENENMIRNFPSCGIIAGVMARTDTERGVWKAPAGLDASLKGVLGLTVNLTDEENGELNKLGVNCLRSFFGGPVIWGSRTLRGDDRFADEWKYIPVRRTALYIEESLYRGTQWVVFEPNDEKLWSQIRLNVGAFMQDLFVKGAFQGTDPKKAYFVKCDSETTTQTDIDRGIVNILVGFAPLKPAEFVVIKIQQITQTGVGA